ncbi:MAG: M50 family metallopeptidase [Bacteroidota bacterium]
MKNSTLVRIILILIIYFALKYLGGPYGRMILYPITLFVTFLHEFGHALGALLTGGQVINVQINEDGSGFMRSSGGSAAIILMGGYLGSAILGNLLFYIGARKPKLAEWTLYIMAASMVLTAVKWFNSPFTTALLVGFAIVFWLIASRTKFDQEVLMFLGLASILYIIQDFNVGPSSDLEKYAELFVVLPTVVWMYIWLFVALLLTFLNLRMIFKKDRRSGLFKAAETS